MVDKLWKAFERWLAAFLGGRRVPITGRARGDAPDIAHPTLSIEAKVRKGGVAQYIHDALEQALAADPGKKKLSIAVFHQTGTPHSKDIVCAYLYDYREWHDPRGQAD